MLTWVLIEFQPNHHLPEPYIFPECPEPYIFSECTVGGKPSRRDVAISIQIFEDLLVQADAEKACGSHEKRSRGL